MMFYFIILLLCLVAAGFVIAPLWFRGRVYEQGRQALNVQLFRERIADLDEADEEAQNLELEARQDLLKDAGKADPAGVETSRNHGWIVAAAFLVPVVAGVMYMDFGLGRGAISDVRLMNKLRSLDVSDQAAYEEMLNEVAERAADRPKDGELNFFLARTYQSLGRYDESLAILKRLLSTFPNDAGLRSAYAEALFISSNRRMTAEVRQAVDQALAMNPHDIGMLEVRGVAAIAEGRRGDAVDWFKKALTMGVSGQRADMLRRAIASLDPETEAETNGRSLTVQVSVGDEVSAPEGAAVFVYARAVAGPPAPLAVQRLTVSGLPRTVILNESMAMVEGMGLADFEEVIVIARISRTGDVVPKSGDYEVRTEVIDMNEIPDQIKLVIADPVSL